MITKILTLFKIARRIAQSDIINIISRFHEVPKTVKFFSYMLSFSFSNSNKLDNKNINEEILFDLWDVESADFEDACVDYVKENSIKQPDSLVKKIGKLCHEKFTRFIGKVTNVLQSDVIIKLEKNWLKENYSDDNLENLIFNTDFNKISMNDKWNWVENLKNFKF